MTSTLNALWTIGENTLNEHKNGKVDRSGECYCLVLSTMIATDDQTSQMYGIIPWRFWLLCYCVIEEKKNTLNPFTKECFGPSMV